MIKLCLLVVVGVVVLGQGSNVWAGHDHQHQGYFQYANVPAYGQYEFGYNRGNPYHYTSRYEQGHDWRFRTKVRWGDKNGYGEHYWDYNHVDKGGHKGKGHGHQSYGHEGYGHGHQQHHGWQPHGHGHGHHHGSYSEISPAVVKAQNQPNGPRPSNNNL